MRHPIRKNCTARKNRTALKNHIQGFTLIELMVSLITASILLIGLSSTLFIAIRIADPQDSMSANAMDAQRVLADMFSDLQHTHHVVEQTSTAITAVVPDRNGDTNAETIRYSWSGMPGDPLLQNINSAPINSTVAENVHYFELEYYQPSSVIEYVSISIQIGSNSQTCLKISVPMLNQP